MSLNKEELAKLLKFYKKQKYFPTSLVQLLNRIKWLQFQKQLYRHFEQMSNYNDEELDSLGESLYEYLLEKHSWIANYEKHVLMVIIKRLLLTNSPDDLKNKIAHFELEQLRAYIERKMEEELL
jgi:hypothetical protein